MFPSVSPGIYSLRVTKAAFDPIALDSVSSSISFSAETDTTVEIWPTLV